jgi:predicted methyltransferase
MKLATICLAFVFGLAACAHGPDRHEAREIKRINKRVDKVLAGDWREPANVARDPYRHPRQTLAFFGIRRDMTVIEVWPSKGWYSEILAPYLRKKGHYIAAMSLPERSGDEQAQASAQKALDGLRGKFAKNPDIYERVQVLQFEPAAPVLGPPGSADAVLTFRNVHNWVQAGSEAQMFEAMFEVLKPGGVLGVVDHRAADGKELAEVNGSGYLPEAYVISLAVRAGFQLQARSEINANPRDTKDYPKGVWTLPPTLTLGDVDRDKYLAIGESDRMTLRFVKPAD